MEEITYENRILAIGDKPVDGDQIRSMTDKELRHLIDALYEIGYDNGWTDGHDYGYDDGYDEGWSDHANEFY